MLLTNNSAAGRSGTDQLQLLASDSAAAQPLKRLIQHRFAAQYDADVCSFMPFFLWLPELDTVSGLKPASCGPLFLEQYLDQPIEQVVAAVAERPMSRDRIVEVGNLAVNSAGGARVLIAAMTSLLHSQGFEWVVFTATPALINSFKRMGLSPVPVANADPRRIAEADRWGSYYDARPQVMVGSIAGGYRQLQRFPMLKKLIEQLPQPIQPLALR